MINEKELDTVVEEAKKAVSRTSEEINSEKLATKNNKPILENDIPKKKISLGDLGTFKKATKEEVDEVFSHLPGLIFQVHKCMFRVSYIHDTKHTFTAELINAEDGV